MVGFQILVGDAREEEAHAAAWKSSCEDCIVVIGGLAVAACDEARFDGFDATVVAVPDGEHPLALHDVLASWSTYTTDHAELLSLPRISDSMASLKSGHCLSFMASRTVLGTGTEPTSLTL